MDGNGNYAEMVEVPDHWGTEPEPEEVARESELPDLWDVASLQRGNEILRQAPQPSKNHRKDKPAGNSTAEFIIQSASRYKVLTHEEEMEIGQKIAEATNEEERKLWIDKLVNHNLKLLINLASRSTYKNRRGIHFEDLIQEGSFGLRRAAEKFDYKRGLKFSTYATWWIRQAIARYGKQGERTIYLPIHKVEAIGRVHAATAELTRKLGRAPTVEEIAEHADMTPPQVQKLQELSVSPVSLQTPIMDGDGMLEDLVPGNGAESVDSALDIKELRLKIRDALATLSEREAQIVCLYMGIPHSEHPRYEGGALTFEDIGPLFGLTRERIRQIYKAAIRKIRLKQEACHDDLEAFVK